jgi:Restriction alleviation protein Lar
MEETIMTEFTDEDRAALKLASCPFCAGAAVHVTAAHPKHARYVMCIQCNNATAMADTAEHATALWNCRAPADALSRSAQPIPREPTQAMIDAGSAQIPLRYSDKMDVRDAWMAMYDAALMAAMPMAPANTGDLNGPSQEGTVGTAATLAAAPAGDAPCMACARLGHPCAEHAPAGDAPKPTVNDLITFGPPAKYAAGDALPEPVAQRDDARDADRYRRIRACFRIGSHGEWVALVNEPHCMLDEAQFDAAIDAAIAQSKERAMQEGSK